MHAFHTVAPVSGVGHNGSAMASEQEAHLLERLERAGPVRTRRMFGGIGIYSGEVFFALIANEVLYLKVDEKNRPDFEARGMAPFQPFPDRPSTMAYYELPIDVLDDVGRLRAWVEKALDAARAAKAGKGPQRATRKSPAPQRKRVDQARVVEEKILNLGPVSRRWLADVGVKTRADLERRGSVAVYRAVQEKGHAVNALLLYALEGALLGLRFDRLPDAVKQNLRQRAGLD